jgi:hypothetical protein
MSESHPEEWRPIPGYDGGYEVSSDGQVRSTTRGRYPGRVLRPHNDGKGYMRVNLSIGGARSQVAVHTLVLFAFHGPRPSGGTASHLNGDPTDNRAANLLWESWSANHARKREHGTALVGEQNHMARLTDDQVRAIRAMHKAGSSPEDIALFYNITASSVCKICLRQSWTHI